MNEAQLVNEIREKYGSVSKMIAGIHNECARLREHGGHAGRDSADTLDYALQYIPTKYHRIYYKYAYSTAKPNP